MLKRWLELQTEKTIWLLDLEFLLSNYQCNWGNGCKGIDPKSPDLGCCANGAHLEDYDVETIKKRVPLLTPQNWQNYGSEYLEKTTEKNKFGINRFSGYKTKTVNSKDKMSGCIFANRTGFSGGAGCALHISALQEGISPLETKPHICWQMPLYVDYVESIDTHVLRMYWWDKEAYDWFCAQDEINWVGDNPVFRTMSAELEKLVNSYDDTAYPRIKELLESAWSQSNQKPNRKRIPVTLISI